jgi:hypothetical protein
MRVAPRWLNPSNFQAEPAWQRLQKSENGSSFVEQRQWRV